MYMHGSMCVCIRMCVLRFGPVILHSDGFCLRGNRWRQIFVFVAVPAGACKILCVCICVCVCVSIYIYIYIYIYTMKNDDFGAQMLARWQICTNHVLHRSCNLLKRKKSICACMHGCYVGMKQKINRRICIATGCVGGGRGVA